MPFFAFALHRTVVPGAAQYNHCLLLVATGSCPVQSSRSVTASLPSRFLSDRLTSLWLCFLCPNVCSIFHPSSSFVVFYFFTLPSFSPRICLSCFFPFYSVSFSLSLSLSIPRSPFLMASISHSLSLSLSLSLSVSLYNLLISPLPFCVSETFLFNWLCFSFGLSGSFCLCLGFYFLLAAPLLVSQIPPVKPCYGHLTGHYKGLDAPRVLDPGSHH